MSAPGEKLRMWIEAECLGQDDLLFASLNGTSPGAEFQRVKGRSGSYATRRPTTPGAPLPETITPEHRLAVEALGAGLRRAKTILE